MKLIENWSKIWWRRWSTWLAAITGFSVSVILADPHFLGLVSSWLSGDERAVKAALAGLFVAVVPVIITHLKQTNLQK